MELIYESKEPLDENVRVLNKTERKKLLIAGNLGSFLEIFDFTVYAFFASTIGEVFFKMQNPLMTLLISTVVFATGFIMRPLGSIILGGYCDHHGRKAGLFLAIMLMGVGSAMIAFAPTYEMIGIAAPILLLFGRLLQGFSAGGQIAAAGSLLMESAPKNQRGYFVSWQFVVQGFSSLFGGFFAYLVYNYLTEEQVLSFGWRLPFIFSLLIVPVGFYIRKHLHETHQKTEEKRTIHPFKFLMQKHKWQMIKFICMLSPCTVVTYVMVFFMPHYLELNHIIEAANRYLISVYASVLVIIATLSTGYLCDRVPKRKPLLLMGFIVCLICSYLCFAFINHWTIFLINYTIVAFLSGFLMVVPFLFIVENYEKKIRVTASGSIYALTIAIFGGPAQTIVTALMNWSDKNLMAPFWYLGFSLILGIIFALLLEEKPHEE